MAKSAGITFKRVIFGSFLLLVVSLAVQKPGIAYLFGYHITATDALFPIVAGIALIGVFLKLVSVRWSVAYLFFGAYISAFFLSAIFSANVANGFVKSLSTAYLVGLAVLSLVLIEDERSLRIVIAAWLIGASIPAAVGIFTIALYYFDPTHPFLPYVTYHFGAVPVGNFPRLSSTFVSASMFCNYLNVTLLIFLIAATFNRFRSPVWWIIFATLVLCSLFTVSIGLGAVIFGVSLWAFFRMKDRASRYAVLIGGGFICAVFLTSSLVALQQHTTAPFSISVPWINSEFYPSSRLLVWRESLQTFINNFLTGNGPGMPSASVIYQNTEGGFSLLTDAHNSFLSVAAQTGLFGLAALIALCAFVLKRGFARSDGSPIQYGLWIAFLSAFVLQGLTGAFEDARHLWVLIGVLLAASRLFSERDESGLSVEI